MSYKSNEASAFLNKEKITEFLQAQPYEIVYVGFSNLNTVTEAHRLMDYCNKKTNYAKAMIRCESILFSY